MVVNQSYIDSRRLEKVLAATPSVEEAWCRDVENHHLRHLSHPTLATLHLRCCNLPLGPGQYFDFATASFPRLYSLHLTQMRQRDLLPIITRGSSIFPSLSSLSLLELRVSAPTAPFPPPPPTVLLSLPRAPNTPGTSRVSTPPTSPTLPYSLPPSFPTAPPSATSPSVPRTSARFSTPYHPQPPSKASPSATHSRRPQVRRTNSRASSCGARTREIQARRRSSSLLGSVAWRGREDRKRLFDDHGDILSWEEVSTP